MSGMSNGMIANDLEFG